MRKGWPRSLLVSQVCFWVTMLLDVALAPASLGANDGISYFGHHRVTVAPFELGMFAAAYFLLQARRATRLDPALGFLTLCLTLVIVGVVGVAIAPAVGNGWVDGLHRVFGSLTFVTQLVLAVWFNLVWPNGAVGWLLFCLQLSGGVVAAVYLAPAQGFSIQGQLLFQLAFTALLVRVLSRLPAGSTARPSDIGDPTVST